MSRNERPPRISRRTFLQGASAAVAAPALALCPALLHEERLRRVGELDSFLFKSFVDVQVDRFVNVHVLVIVRPLYVVHRFEVDRIAAVFLEIGTVETCLFLLLMKKEQQ